MVAPVFLQWLGSAGVGQVAQCCEQLIEEYPQLYDATLSDAEQNDLAVYQIDEATLTPAQKDNFAALEARCCNALKSTGTPQGTSTSAISLQRQINQILTSRGCPLKIGEDGKLGPETCGVAKMIVAKNWGSISVPASCASYSALDISGCQQTAPNAAPTPVPVKKSNTGVLLLAVAALLGVGFALAGRA